MIRLSGASEAQVRIDYTGIRPGEKLNEQLIAEEEASQPTPHPKLRIVRAAAPANPRLAEELEAWIAAPGATDADSVRAWLRRATEVPVPVPGVRS